MFMSLLKAFTRKKEDFAKYRGDSSFLSAATAAAALIVNADGNIEDSEIDAAIKGLSNHELLSSIYKGSEIEDALNKSISDSKTRAGKLALTRAIEGLQSREISSREDVFMIAADVADQGGIGPEERKALDNIAGILRLDAKKLLGE